jgi:hypothetical protein
VKQNEMLETAEQPMSEPELLPPWLEFPDLLAGGWVMAKEISANFGTGFQS